MSDSPLSVDGEEWTEEAVFDFLVGRIMVTEEEWKAEPEHEWNITREEAATRLDVEDYSVPDFLQ